MRKHVCVNARFEHRKETGTSGNTHFYKGCHALGKNRDVGGGETNFSSGQGVLENAREF